MLKKIVKTEAVKRFKVAAVSQAIGYSEGSISAYFSQNGVPTKGGITVQQVEELLENASVGSRRKTLKRETDEVLQALALRGWVDEPEEG